MKKILLSVMLFAFSGVVLNAQKKTETITSDLLTDWMSLHCRMVRSAKGIAHVAYSRHFAYTAIAAFESVVAGDPSFRSLANQLNGLSGLPSVPKIKPDCEQGLNAAYAAMLRHFYSAFEPCLSTIDSMEKVQRTRRLTSPVNEKQLTQSTAWGNAIAAAIIKWSESDSSSNVKIYMPLKGEGIWAPETTAAAPFWSLNRSLTKNIFSAYFLKEPVYAPGQGSDFYKMAHEVYTTSRNLTPEQKATALYWDDSPNGQYMTVFGHWAFVTASLIQQHRLPLLKAAETFAKVAISMHEASLLAWKGKYQYHVLRPDKYINQFIDPKWKSLIATPNHPEFPAAHATLSASAATALGYQFGENCAVTDNSYTDIGMRERRYASLQEMAREAGYSRLYGGIHYSYSIEQGFLLGNSAARHVNETVQFHRQQKEQH